MEKPFKGKNVSEEEVSLIVMLLEAGVSHVKIAKATGRSTFTVAMVDKGGRNYEGFRKLVKEHYRKNNPERSPRDIGEPKEAEAVDGSAGSVRTHVILTDPEDMAVKFVERLDKLDTRTFI